jgi:hypothetical protein
VDQRHRIRHLPNAFARLGQPTTVLGGGAFLVATGRLAHEETTGSKLWLNELVNLNPGASSSALRIAIESSNGTWPASDMRPR